MKFPTLFIIALIISSCATTYKATDLSNRISSHKKIAILPFDAIIQYKKLPKNSTREQIKEIEEDMGYVFQQQMYTRFLKKSSDYHIEFQDISKTNALLKKNNIEYANFKEYTNDEIAKVLNVDAVVSGKILTSKLMSTGGAIALEMFTDHTATTNEVSVNVSLYDAIDAKLLFNYDHTYSGGVGSSPEQLTKELMKDIEKKFPYRK